MAMTKRRRKKKEEEEEEEEDSGEEIAKVKSEIEKKRAHYNLFMKSEEDGFLFTDA